ncbi:energy-coupling factor ABC transporter ATP-binding protein [Brevibacterium aurantiacum]|uniref:energy-coupling factor ABC transporter ATP-binding protein n=2 Tax=Brevibacterium aurantiacum TaxID=273384 RepID=UPI000BB83FA9|nr:ABC transporter ATP-binding protein [Brevibacterium aurantiacum]AZL10185.1 ABC transporter ATP-binding protein [Brevibacterium aurantiacum]PCC56882.1 cobalt ABC transporter ATP-binding protein [Brevibacterium aurantiacum]
MIFGRKPEPESMGERVREISFSEVSVGVLDDTPAGDVYRPILTDVNVTLDESTIAIIGANGSGKSTLLQLFNGLVTANSGRVLIDGLDPIEEAKQVRSRVGFVFTDPAAQLVMPTPLEDIELSLRKRVPKAECRAAALAVLEELGIADLAERSVYELSGGQRQLVALAAVLAVDPQILVLDEPTTLLDLRNKEKLRKLLADLVARRGVRVIFSTHDLDFAGMADRALVVDSGRIVHDSTPDEATRMYRELIMSDSS